MCCLQYFVCYSFVNKLVTGFFKIKMEYDDLPFVEELMFELNDLDRVLHGEESSSEEEVDLRERRNEVIHRMAPFYANRNDIFHIFNDEQVYKVFRFDKPSIYHIVGKFTLIYYKEKYEQTNYSFFNVIIKILSEINYRDNYVECDIFHHCVRFLLLCNSMLMEHSKMLLETY